MKRNKIRVYLYCTVIILGLLTSCSREPIKIGLMMDLTGRASAIGISGRNGAEMAFDEVNESGGINGRKIEGVVKDDKGIPEVAEQIDKDLLKEGIVLAIGHLASGAGLKGYGVFQEGKMLMISPTMSTDSLSGIDDYFLRIIASNKIQGELLANTALLNHGRGKIAMLYEYNNRSYSHEVCKYFKSRYEAAGGQMVDEESYTSSPETNFDSLAETIVSSGAEGALIVTAGLDLAIIVQKVKALKKDMQIYTGMRAMTDDLLENGGKAVEGVYLPGTFDQQSDKPEYLAFKKRYEERFRIEPTFASVYCYETVQLVADALRKTEKLDSDSIKKVILDTKYFKGLQNDFSIDAFGDSDRSYFLFQVKNGTFQREIQP